MATSSLRGPASARTALGQDGRYGVFAQRFVAATRALDIDGNGVINPQTDGLLVLRSEFGFSGATLTNGAIGGGCARCDAAAIEPHLADLGLTLDIDGNGTLAALTDGLLVLRFLLGFMGPALTSGVVGGACTRCDAAAIEPYLARLDS
jgi:large repetitive protein